MPSIDTEAVILRSIRFSEADVVLSIYSPTAGRISGIAKGARRATSKLGGRLQPGVWVHLGIVQGRGDLGTVRSASIIEAHAGLWLEGYRLRAASSVLETVLRAVPEHEASPEIFHLLTRTLALLSQAPPQAGPPRLDPIVLGFPGETAGGQRPAATVRAHVRAAMRRVRWWRSRPTPAGRCARRAPAPANHSSQRRSPASPRSSAIRWRRRGPGFPRAQASGWSA